MSEEYISPLHGAENPDLFTGLKLGSVKTSAAGFPAVFHAFQHVFGEAGVVRGLKALSKLNQKGGFDCPSCAWPDPDDERSGIAEYCENGAKAVAEEATAKKLTPDFFAQHSVQELAGLTDYEIGRKGRIAQPMFLPKGATHYQPVSWDAAFDKIANTLNSLSSPNEAVFYTSGRTSNEAAFLYQLFVRAYGTNNLPDCSNMCHESSGVALGESLGNRSPVDWNKYLLHYDRIRDDIERTIPGFDQYNKRVRLPGGFYLPNCNREGRFDTATSKAHFNVAMQEVQALDNDELLMMTIRSHDQFNTTIYGLDDRYRGIYHERRVIFMNEADMRQQGLQSGDVVDLFNYHDDVERVAHRFIVVPYAIPVGCTATYFPETNVLVPIGSVAEKSNTPTSKYVVIRVRRREE